MKNFFKKYKKNILKVLLLLGIALFVAFIVLLFLYLFNVIEIDSSGFSFNSALFDSYKNKWYGYLIFILIEAFLTILLCAIPGTSMAFIVLGIAIYGANWKTFLLCFASVVLSSIGMDLVGRFGGEKIIVKMFSQEEYDKAHEMVTKKGIAYIPVMYLFPLFPDDLICMITGTLRINFVFHVICIVLCRGIGIATIVFGVSILPEEVANFTSKNVWDYIEVVTILLFWILFALWASTKANKMVEKFLVKKEIKQQENEEKKKWRKRKKKN